MLEPLPRKLAQAPHDQSDFAQHEVDQLQLEFPFRLIEVRHQSPIIVKAWAY